MQINDSTPLAALTVGQFKELFGEGTTRTEGNTDKNQPEPNEKRYLYSIKELASFLNVSYKTAWTLKDTVLRPAVYQQGRVIMIDAEKVLELMSNERRNRTATASEAEQAAY